MSSFTYLIDLNSRNRELERHKVSSSQNKEYTDKENKELKEKIANLQKDLENTLNQ